MKRKRGRAREGEGRVYDWDGVERRDSSWARRSAYFLDGWALAFCTVAYKGER